jgi:hypothetical protein
MFDFGIDTPTVNFLLSKNYHNGSRSYLCQIDHQALSTGLKDKITPTWSVCLIEMDKPLEFSMVCYYKKLNYGKLKRFKQFPPEWTELEKNLDGKLGNYVVMTNDKKKCQKFFSQNLTIAFAELIASFKSGLIPKCITLQINNDCIAVYGEYFNFDEAEQYIRCYDFARLCFNYWR